MFAVSPTDLNWFNYLKDNGFNSFVNFWTPTPWNVSKLSIGDKLYFLLKSPYRKLGGFGEFVLYKNISATEAWNEFGLRNGRASQELMFESIINYLQRNSKVINNDDFSVNTHRIGCIVLKNCEYWDEEYFMSPNDLGISFPSQVVKMKYFQQAEPQIFENLNANEFVLIDDDLPRHRRLATVRVGQGMFKGRILGAYNNQCCVSGPCLPELLEAAHIQPYINKNSNHIRNGILLRVDIHRLYDNGLLYIDEEYVINVSPLVLDPYYQSFNGTKITLPARIANHPSKQALCLRKESFRVH
ncbi:HNH endonuclease [Pollutibacter soli]|uniref:HNH endonuclease n=1 Tax=Pollutibacter soli TaxID=3034157 RepID=UPI003013B442